jgi:hypothetical protein
MKQRTGFDVSEVWCVFITSGVEVCCLTECRVLFFSDETSPLCGMNSNTYIDCIFYIFIYCCVVFCLYRLSVFDIFQEVELVLKLYSLFGNQKIALVELLKIVVLAITVPHIKDQFEGHNLNRSKDSLIMAFKKCRNM